MMDYDQQSLDRRLRRAGTAVFIVGALRIALFVLQVVNFYSTYRSKISPANFNYTIANWLFNLIPAILYLVFNGPIRRGNYGAWAAAVVLGIYELIKVTTQTLWVLTIVWGGFRTDLIYSAIFVTVYVAMVCVLLAARRSLKRFPQPEASMAAKSRAVMALYLLAALIAVSVVASEVTYPGFDVAMAYLPSSTSSRGRIVLLLAISAVGYAFLKAGLVLRHKRRPDQWMCWLVGVVLFSRVVINSYSSFGRFDRTIGSFLNAALLWCLIELLHARRVSTDPASFGFEPIFAQPVLPVTNSPFAQGDANGTSR
jgi:hypothetical protein